MGCAARGLVLPDMGMLMVIYANRASVAGFSATDNYWSSSPGTSAGNMYFVGSGTYGQTNWSIAIRVRCARLN